jgi:hypothetical protein
MTSNSEIINNVEEQGGKPLLTDFNSLNRFIKKYRNNDNYSHVGMDSQSGKYCFGTKIDKFYVKYLNQDAKHIAEKRGDYSQFVIDIDIKKTKEEYENQLWLDNKFYTIEHVEALIKVCQEQIKKIYFAIQDIQLDAVLLEKDIYQKNENTWSGGLHIQFPNLYVKTETIKNSLIPCISKELKKIDGMPKEFVEMDISAMCIAPWLLYGSTKSADSKPYLISKIFNYELQEMTVEKRLLEYKIYDTDEAPISLTSKNLDKNLPRILSINPSHRHVNEIKKKYDNPTPPVVKEKEKKEYIDNRPLDEIRNEVKKLLSCLSQNRVDDQYQWKCVGWCLYNISDGDDEFFDMWNEWSEKSDKYVGEDDCRQYWKSTDHEKYNMGSLKWMARKDNEQMYFDVLKINKKDDDNFIFMDFLLKGLPDLECAETFYEFNKDSIFYSKVDGYIVFNEKDKLWRQNVEKSEILTMISKFYREKIEGECSERAEEMIRQQLIKQIDECEDKKQKKKLQTKLDNVGKEIRASHNRIQSSKWAFGVLHHVDNLFKINHQTEKMSELLDNIEWLYPMREYVIDLRTTEIRPRVFDDFFTYTNDTEYIPIESRNTIGVIQYHKEILATQDENYIKNVSQIAAYNLCGDNTLKKVVYYLGEGNNGKSVYMNLNSSINKSMVKAPERAFIKKGNQSLLQSELECLIKKRAAIINEPDEGDVLNENTIKQISGNDRDIEIRARADSGYTTRRFICKISVVLNEMIIHKCKKGMSDRTLVIDFPNKFQKNPEKEREIKELKNHYFSYLIDLLKEMYENDFNITFCHQMIDSTNREKTAQDSIKQFIDEQIEFTENIDDQISGEHFNELYRNFCHRNDITMENKIKVGKRLRKDYGYSDENRKKHSKYGIIYLYIKRKEFQENIEIIEDDGIPEM